jgi:hypothetical protein
VGEENISQNFKRHNRSKIGMPKGDKKENGAEAILDAIMGKNFIKLMTPNHRAHQIGKLSKMKQLVIEYSNYKKKDKTIEKRTEKKHIT